MNKTAKISMYYFYDKRGRRKNISLELENAKRIWIKKRCYMYSPLYCEYVTEKTLHVITVIAAFYNYKDDSITVVNRDDI